jgi:hypothetical protein
MRSPVLFDGPNTAMLATQSGGPGPNGVGMKPYVVCQGDTLTRLAYRYGFDVDAVWNNAANDDLRAQRSDRDCLLATDVVYIPDETDAPPFSLPVGSSITFTSDPPTVRISVHFPEAQFASQACTIDELEDLTELSTDGTGLLSFDAPVTLETASIVFASLGVTYSCRIGYLDPIETLSGVFQRLQSMGYIADDVAFDPDDLDLIRDALAAVKDGDGDYGSPPFDSSPPSSSDPSASDSVVITVAISPGDTKPAGGASGDDSSDVTVNDDGTLDDATRAMLVNAYGC